MSSSLAATKPEWLPDWRDAHAYKDHGEDAIAWAWEFLRRNADYQADYLKLSKGLVDESALKDRWYVFSIFPPEDTDAPFPWNVGDVPPYGLGGTDFRCWDRSDDQYVMLYGIDLRYNIKSQLKEIEKDLASVKRQGDAWNIPKMRRKCPQYGKLIGYLRVFDAKLCGVKNADIARALYPCEKKAWPKHVSKKIADSEAEEREVTVLKNAQSMVSRDYLVAKTLIESGYRDLLRWGLSG